jgi:hypothetical protein
VKSRLAALRKRRRHLQLRTAIERSGSWDRCASGRLLARSCRVQVIRGCARGSYRLQKSTSGAWPLATVDEESADPPLGLALPRESARKGERASEAESSVAKPRDRWRVPANRRQPRKRPSWEHLSRKGALSRDKPSSLTRWRWKRFWFLADVRNSGRQRGATGSVRGRSPALCSADNVGPGKCHRQKVVFEVSWAERSTKPRVRSGRSWSRAVKRVPNRSRIAEQSVVRRRSEETDLGRGSIQRFSVAQATNPEVERSTGARVVSRLQRSVRSILSEPSRGAARRTQEGAG